MTTSEHRGDRHRTQSASFPAFSACGASLARGCRWHPAGGMLVWSGPSHLRKRENRSRLRSKGSRRSYQLVSPPLPLTQFSMQGSDLIFFFPPLSQGVSFHFLCSPSLCLGWTRLKAQLRGERTAGTPRSQQRPQRRAPRWGWEPGNGVHGAHTGPAASGRAGIQSAASAVLRLPLAPGRHALEHSPS